jgi:Protein of unknown function (DUF3570)
MQLKKTHKPVQAKKKNIREKLALATCALLQVTGTAAQAADEWDVDSAIMLYSEGDGRVSAIEPVIAAKKEIAEDEFINVKLVLDSLTGATPNGAHASGTVQTFTNPSGNASYTTQIGDNPLDDTFLDTRVALSADWEQPVIDDMTRMILGANISSEFDYMSLGVSATLMRDYNQRNTTLAAAIGVNADSINPSGGIPTPFANMRDAGAGINRDGDSDSKTIVDLMVGVTQVISRKTLMQFNLSLSSTSGYMTDPYKVITIVDATGGLDLTTYPTVGSDLPYVYEKRPDSRSRQVFFWKTVHHLTEDVINVSYRYHTDDWDINSHTIDFHYRYELNDGAYLQPHLRYYTQTAAEFFTHNLLATDTPQFASADYRLGEFTTTTIGLKYSQPLGKNQEFNVRAELISQANEVVTSNLGTLAGDAGAQEIAPDLDATVIQFGYSFKW